MARKKREWYPGAIYHVMSRGNRQKAIFKDEDDYIQFLNYIKIVQQKYPFKLHAYCLMTNHFHLEIETHQDEIWKIMQKILSLYSSEFNHKTLVPDPIKKLLQTMVNEERFEIVVICCTIFKNCATIRNRSGKRDNFRKLSFYKLISQLSTPVIELSAGQMILITPFDNR